MPADTDPTDLISRARDGDRRALARAISIVEDNRSGQGDILAAAFSKSGNAWTTGLTGAPGAGKSTLTDRLIGKVRGAGDEVAVLAVDPSSPFTGGAILGDRVRMQDHVDDRGVYIRSMASRGHLGGVAEATPKVLAVLDGAGFPEILVETVGVGQAEVEIAANADTTVVVLNPGWGDSIQAAKAGLLEIGDVFAVNKADRPGVNDTIRDLKQMMELGEHGEWWPPVVPTIASTGEGLQELWEQVIAHREFLVVSGGLTVTREERLLASVDAAIAAELTSRVDEIRSGDSWPEVSKLVLDRSLDPWSAARRLLDGS
jgi:LAO/AO transport system kinase